MMFMESMFLMLSTHLLWPRYEAGSGTQPMGFCGRSRLQLVQLPGLLSRSSSCLNLFHIHDVSCTPRCFRSQWVGLTESFFRKPWVFLMFSNQQNGVFSCFLVISPPNLRTTVPNKHDILSAASPNPGAEDERHALVDDILTCVESAEMHWYYLISRVMLCGGGTVLKNDGTVKGAVRWVRWYGTVGTVGTVRWVRYGGYGTVGTVGTARWVRWVYGTVGTVRLVRWVRYGGYAGYGTVGTLGTVRWVRWVVDWSLVAEWADKILVNQPVERNSPKARGQTR